MSRVAQSVRWQTARRLSLFLLGAYASASAWPADARLFSYNDGTQLPPPDSRPGYASVQHSNRCHFGFASGIDFLSGAGGMALANASCSNMQAASTGGFIDQIFVDDGCGGCQGDFLMRVPMTINGKTSASGSRDGDSNHFGGGQAAYNYEWSVNGGLDGNVAGSGGVDLRFLDDGTQTRVVTGDGDTGRAVWIKVRHGLQLALAMRANLFAAADNFGHGGGSTAVDFSHTLMWGGVSALRDAAGHEIDVPGLGLSSPLTGTNFLNMGLHDYFGNQADAAYRMPMQFGFNGAVGAQSSGMRAARRTAASVLVSGQADGWAACAAGGSDVKRFKVKVPAGALLARFALFDADTGAAGQGLRDDLNLYVLAPDGSQAGSSATPGTASERINLRMPSPGHYQVCVHAVAAANGLSSDFVLSSWVLAPHAGSLRVSGVPTDVTRGQKATISLKHRRLAAGARYLGALRLFQGAAPESAKTIGVTMVEADLAP